MNKLSAMLEDTENWLYEEGERSDGVMVSSEFHLPHGVYPLASIAEHDKAVMGS